MLLAVLLGRTRIGFRAAFGEDGVRGHVTFGPFRFQVLPAGKDGAEGAGGDAGAARKKKPKKKPPRPERKGPFRPTFAQIQDGIRVLAPAAKRALRRTRRSLRVDPLNFRWTLGGARDPAAAAEHCGQAQAGLWTVMPALERLVDIPDPRIHIGLDFDAEEDRLRGEAGASIPIWALLAAAGDLGIPALRWYTGLRKENHTTGTRAAPAAAGREDPAA